MPQHYKGQPKTIPYHMDYWLPPLVESKIYSKFGPSSLKLSWLN